MLRVHVLCFMTALSLLSVSHADPEVPRDPEALKAIIAEIRIGWENGDPAPFERHYLDYAGARYIESGGQNVGLRDLIEHHVVPEKETLKAMKLVFDNIDVHFENDFAWAVADVRVRATVRSDGREVDRSGFETFLFRYVASSWKVVHTHSSTRPAGK